MEAKELRLGNFVAYNTDGYTHQTVKGIYNENEVDTGYRKLLTIDKLFPIPLTEEWLIKLGFVNIVGYVWAYGSFKIHSEHDGTYWFSCTVRKSILVETVHQLQNIFHAITGQELTISETVEK